MSNNKKFNPEILGFYALVVVLVIIVSLSVVEGGKWVYHKVKGDDDTIVEQEYGDYYEFKGNIPSISYSGVFSKIESDTNGYYVITLDLDDDYNCESCGDLNDDIIEFLTAYVDDEDKDVYPSKIPLYIMNLNDNDNDKILGDANNGTISSYVNEDTGGYKELKIDKDLPISIMFINGYSGNVEITNSPSELGELLAYLTDEYYFYECEDCEE